MWQFLTRYRGLVVVGALCALPLVLLYAQTKSPGSRGPVAGVVVDVAASIERALLWATGGILDGIEHYVTSVRSYDELVRLRREENASAALRARIAELEGTNEELRGLARAMDRIDGPRALGARVLGRSGAPLSRLLTIDRGSVDGVRRGDGVISKDGVVGQVLVAGRYASDVLLLTDPGSAIDVVVQRTRARGVLRGAGEDDRYAARVEDFDKLRDVKRGDRLVTSGLGARFPVGLFVGIVLDAASPDDSLYQRADVKPAVAFHTLEMVGVLVGRERFRVSRLGREAMPDDDDMAANAEDGPTPPPPPEAKPGEKKPATAAPATTGTPAAPVTTTPVKPPAPDAGVTPAPPASPPTPTPVSPPTTPPPATPRDAGVPR